MNSKKPFGKYYEEVYLDQEDKVEIEPIYSEENQYSEVLLHDGSWMPFVEYVGKLATQTVTRVKTESAATDPSQGYVWFYFIG